MHQHQEQLEVLTEGRSTTDITAEVASIISQAGVQMGLCTILCRHTSASLVIQENADPAVQRDLLAWLERIAPDADPRYTHTAEGPDDMAAHLRSAVTRSNETIPISGGSLTLGTWQGIYLVEHRARAHQRRVVVHVIGE
jgi:secondary thiamine-phosphate synthase enzyme